mmetsp:Transcript_11398/g.19229  ORF Transcript_11398/g.19229 Transcript_11398/m.19229 type:complete len:152 (-) Transcript_11398:1600-2055(-)
MSQQKHVPLRIVLRALLTCLQLFPSSYKQIVGSHRQGSGKQRDVVTHLFEDLTRIFARRDADLARTALTFLCNLFKARDKSKLHFKEWVERCFANLTFLLDALTPRLFSDSKAELNKEIPCDAECFLFLFDPSVSDNQQNLSKLTVKDVRE